MISIKNLISVVLTVIFLSTFTVSAHDSHTHTAPWQACEDKKKSEQCAYKNGDDDLFKGSCQLFSEVLMCVRNQPIIHAVDLTKKANKSGPMKESSDLSASH